VLELKIEASSENLSEPELKPERFRCNLESLLTTFLLLLLG
jgi:hypothetical protein